LNEEKFEIRSDQVQEILGSPPSWIIRWGIAAIGAMFILAFFLAAIIKYPNTIKGNAVITSTNPPVKLINKTPSVIDSIYMTNGQSVRKNDIILQMKSALGQSDLTMLKIFLSAVEPNKIDEITDDKLDAIASRTFGEIQPEINRVLTALKKYRNFNTQQVELKKMRFISDQIQSYKNLAITINNQLRLKDVDVKNARMDYDIDKGLYDQKVLSQTDLLEEETKLNIQLQQFESLQKDLSQNAIIILELEKERVDLENQYHDKVHYFEDEINSALSMIRNFIDDYELTQVIKAPMDGVVDYALSYATHQFVPGGAELATIVPAQGDFICLATVPTTRFSSIKKGQKVMISLDNYPAHEYGQLIGVVKDFSVTYSKENYRLTIDLPGLTTTYEKKLQYLPEMHGSALVITDETTILQRLFNGFRSAIDQKI
jgi:multidrug resistance efflux pump